jgi:hypothetical protein
VGGSASPVTLTHALARMALVELAFADNADDKRDDSRADRSTEDGVLIPSGGCCPKTEHRCGNAAHGQKQSTPQETIRGFVQLLPGRVQRLIDHRRWASLPQHLLGNLRARPPRPSASSAKAAHCRGERCGA